MALRGGGRHPSETIRNQLREIIGKKGTTDVLPDDELVKDLSSKGVGIARRIVAK